MASALGSGTSQPAVSSDDSFQTVLLELSAAAAQGLEFEEMLHLFCRLTREHFRATTVFCWLVKGRELIGLGGYGSDAEIYLGKRMPLDANTYSGRAVRDRVTVLVNDVPHSLTTSPASARWSRSWSRRWCSADLSLASLCFPTALKSISLRKNSQEKHKSSQRYSAT